MAETIYGNVVSHWRAAYTVDISSNTATQYKIDVVGSFAPQGWGFQLSPGVQYNVCVKDQHATGTKDISCAGGSWDWIQCAGVSQTITKTHSTQSIYTGLRIDNSTGYENGTSYAEYYVTVPAKTSYKVTYNANSGSGAPGQQTKWYGENLTLSSTKPTRSGYTFVRWNTKTDNTGTAYNPGATYTGNAALTLYAIWKQQYTITYDANGHGTAPAAVTVNAGNTVTLSNISATGYRFDGWYTAASGGTKRGDANATYTPSASEKLYAHWTQYWTVSYDANGGSGAPANQTKYNGTNLTLSSTAPTRTGYVFQGWGTSASTTTVAYQKGATYTGNAALSLYAVWTVAYEPPSISSIQAFRIASNSATATASPTGGYAKVTFNWSVDTTKTANNTINAITVKYKKKSDSSYSSSADLSDDPTGASGSSIATFEAPIANGYDIQINVTDSSGNAAATVTKYTVVGPATVPFDIQGKGKRIGILSAAPDADNTIRLGATVILDKTQDASGTASNRPALIVGGDVGEAHLELDGNEIMAKANGTSTAALYINNDGGEVHSGGAIIAPRAEFTSTTDASGTANSGPALIIGPRTGAHLELDGNEIMAKGSGTTTALLNINGDGGVVELGDWDGNHIRFDANYVQARNGTNSQSLIVNSNGGSVVIGSLSSGNRIEMSVSGRSILSYSAASTQNALYLNPGNSIAVGGYWAGARIGINSNAVTAYSKEGTLGTLTIEGSAIKAKIGSHTYTLSPIYSYYRTFNTSPATSDHMISTSATTPTGWTSEGVVGYIFK